MISNVSIYYFLGSASTSLS